MSKQNPNQDFYKIGGRAQSDGPDRGEPAKPEQQEHFQQAPKNAHPAVKRAAKRK
jgi:hypothetical protein